VGEDEDIRKALAMGFLEENAHFKTLIDNMFYYTMNCWIHKAKP
jgi:hypothetical protein